MPSRSGVTVLRTIGCYWITTCLMGLIVGAFASHGLRDWISSLGLGTYLAIWLAVLAPGAVAVFLTERMGEA